MEDYPLIVHNKKVYYQIGCRACGRGDNWQIFTDKKECIARCTCGHVERIYPLMLLRDRPDEANNELLDGDDDGKD